jgi:transposase
MCWHGVPETRHLIVHVMTTVATEQDNEAVAEIHQALAAKDVLPNAHLVDQGYSDSQVLSDA